MAQAITQGIDDWGLRYRIKGLCFDTTTSNTGTKNGDGIQLGDRDWTTATQFGLSSPHLRNSS